MRLEHLFPACGREVCWPLNAVYLPLKPSSCHLALISTLTCLYLMKTVKACKKAAPLIRKLKTDLSGTRTPASLMKGKKAGKWSKLTPKAYLGKKRLFKPRGYSRDEAVVHLFDA